MNVTNEHISADKTMLRSAKIISKIFTPFSIPFVAFLILFLFSYLRIMPLKYKMIVLMIVLVNTIIIPFITIFLFRHIKSLDRINQHDRKRRYFPFLIYIISDITCLLIMRKLVIPWYMIGIILSSLIIMVVCFFTNIKWKISEHMAGAGGIIGGLVSFSTLFGYNPIGWLCIFIFVAGALGSARITLGHHNLAEVLAGFVLGFISTILVLHPAVNQIFRVFLL
ncbi:MAG: hypothetical protein WCR86_13455 [Parabacteroides sp.]|nr:hypothetical protein [Bacteroidaceae bacterium]